MAEVEVNQPREAVERMHGGTAALAQSVPVRETFEGKTVWEGVVHVFDLIGHPTATRAYAWSAPIDGSTKQRFFAALHQRRRWIARKPRCERPSSLNIALRPDKWFTQASSGTHFLAIMSESWRCHI
jgi:hypothetical protein